jgi:hypothetical protein
MCILDITESIWLNHDKDHQNYTDCVTNHDSLYFV